MNKQASSAVMSACGLFRYRLEREVVPHPNPVAHVKPLPLAGKVVAFFGVNPSTANETFNDATVKKWIGFCKLWGVRRFLVGNAFAYRSTDVRRLAEAQDAFGDDIGEHISAIIEDADILVPCWGDTGKVPAELRFAFDVLMDALVSSGKPVMYFGLTKGGDPKHPLMLGYDTPLRVWDGEN